jgi:hypothetical protein
MEQQAGQPNNCLLQFAKYAGEISGTLPAATLRRTGDEDNWRQQTGIE